MQWGPILISLLLASAFFGELQDTVPAITRWVGSGLGVVAAGLSWIGTSYTPTPANHRRVGDQFTHLQRQCESVGAAFTDGVIDLPELFQRYERLNEQYRHVLEEENWCPPSQDDFLNARDQIADGQEAYTTQELLDKADQTTWI